MRFVIKSYQEVMSMLKAIKTWYNKQQAISNEYRKEAVKNFAEAGITIKNIKKYFQNLFH